MRYAKFWGPVEFIGLAFGFILGVVIAALVAISHPASGQSWPGLGYDQAAQNETSARVFAEDIKPADTLYGIRSSTNQDYNIQFVTSPDNTSCIMAGVTGTREVYVDWVCVQKSAAKFGAVAHKPGEQWDGLAFILKSVRDGTAKAGRMP